MTPRGCPSPGGGGVGWGGGRSGGRQSRGPAALWLPGELGDESIFCVLDVARVSGAPQDRPKVQERAGRRKAGSAASGQEGGLPRAGRSAAVSEPWLAACTSAELPGAVPSNLVCQAPRTTRVRSSASSYPERRGSEFVAG